MAIFSASSKKHRGRQKHLSGSITTPGRRRWILFLSAIASHKLNWTYPVTSSGIRAQVQTEDGVIQHIFDHTVSCAEGYTDWLSRETVKEIALEKWGIKLDWTNAGAFQPRHSILGKSLSQSVPCTGRTKKILKGDIHG